ncbi:HTTM domain-containing protein [Hyalangium rubrum]|uniref:HTTM domain-containing protein n=1 Tax=Hyalangium rubrum TaxID=3103134 RepID=A0ABU5HBE7_9BACT|nr:HTTM domain-containing protein [Hyalangium sp. s54d21]MDY7230204.1 HTTM domain-containing protein [Hyalangium sp. s54d21]
MRPLRARLLAPVDIAPLAYFRIIFGATLLVEVFRFFSKGWIKTYYIRPDFFFSYYGFEWVKPWPGLGMYVHFAVLGVLAAMLTVGLFYRVAAPLFWLGFSYVFLLDPANYLNHLYLVCLLAFLLIWVPAGRAFSLDTRLGLARPSSTAPTWTLWLIRAQVGLVYFFGGIAKFDADWLSGVPGAMFLRKWELTAPLAEKAWAARLFAFSGTAFDLLVAPALLWRRTRPWAVAAAVAFHLTNANLFRIGIFPWLMIAALPLFFEPSTVRRWLERVWPWRASEAAETPATGSWTQQAGVAFFALWLTLQALLPLRHFLYPGEVNWTEQGHNFSWHMKLRNKKGSVIFEARDPRTGERWDVDPEPLLSKRQYSKMTTRPDLVLQFAQRIARQYEHQGRPGIQVFADVWVSLNGRPHQPLVDPTVDLAAQPHSLRAATWILPLREEAVALSSDEEDADAQEP